MDPLEVAQHNTLDSCWLIIHGQAWDVTDFLAEHPGGAKLLLQHAGKDVTKDYDEIHEPGLVQDILPGSKCKGPVNIDAASQSTSMTKSSKNSQDARPPPLEAMVNADDFEKEAVKHLTPSGWAYYSSGADDELSMRDTRRIFQRISLRPRVLRDVREVSTRTDILGCPSSLPIYISPTGSARYAHAQGEKLIARAAGKEDVIYCMPSNPSNTWDAIFQARVKSSQPLFCQLYLNQDVNKAKAQIQKAVRLGSRAIMVTVDSPVIGKRERDERLTAGANNLGAASAGIAKTSSTGLLNPGLTWKDLEWVRETTSLPVVIKGIQSVEDAVIAYDNGVDGIILSNHGGRSQDTAQAPLITLLEIRKYAPHLLSPLNANGRKFQILLDGGVRRGTDVIKALALGATAVGIGRPVLYSMTRFGEEGIRRLLEILRAELLTNMALIGASSVDALVPEMVNSERVEKEVTHRARL